MLHFLNKKDVSFEILRMITYVVLIRREKVAVEFHLFSVKQNHLLFQVRIYPIVFRIIFVFLSLIVATENEEEDFVLL